MSRLTNTQVPFLKFCPFPSAGLPAVQDMPSRSPQLVVVELKVEEPTTIKLRFAALDCEAGGRHVALLRCRRHRALNSLYMQGGRPLEVRRILQNRRFP